MMIKKQLAVAISAGLALGTANLAEASVYTSTASGFSGDFAISGFGDANPGTFQIALTNVSGVLDLSVPKSGSATGQRIGTASIDYTPANPGPDLVSSVSNWTPIGSATFDTTGITGSNFRYNFDSGTFTSDGVPQSGGSFTASASALNLILGNVFGSLANAIGTGSVAVSHSLSANTWTINVSETPVGGTGFSGLFNTLDARGNQDGRIDGNFSVNGAVSIDVADGIPPAGLTVNDPIQPDAPSPDTPMGTFMFNNIAVGNLVNEAGLVVGLNPDAPLWIDPVVAVGYRYTLAADSDTRFASVQMPGQGTVNDPDGYEVWLFDGTNWVLGGTVAAGGVFTFAGGGVTRFEIRGISADLGLPPADDPAFPIGLTMTNPGTFDLTMTALTSDTGNPVPAPATLSLTGLALTALAAVRRRNQA